MQPMPHCRVFCHEPPVERVAVDGPAAGAPRRRRRARRSCRARRPRAGAEPPRLHAQPGEVLERVADVHELPVDRRRRGRRSSTITLPMRRSPCTSVVGRARRAVGARATRGPSRTSALRSVDRARTRARVRQRVELGSTPGHLGRIDRVQPGEERGRARRRARARASAYSSSRRIRRASVSPGTRASRGRRCRGACRRRRAAPRARAVRARGTRASRRPPAASSPAGPAGRAGRAAGSAPRRRAVNDHVSRDAPPLSRRRSVISTGGRGRGCERGRRARQMPTVVPTGTSSTIWSRYSDEPGAVEVVAAPAGHALGDARDHAVAAVAQRDVRPHVAVHLVGVVVGGDDDAVLRTGTSRRRSRSVSSTSRDLHPAVVAVALDVVQEAVLRVADRRRRRASVHAKPRRAEVDGEPAVPPDVLPDARAPRVVAQPERVGEVEAARRRR